MSSYVQFDVGEQLYAVPVEAVIEVLHLVEITPIPEQANEQLGVINLHGRIIPVIDLSQCYQGRPTPLNINTPMLALKNDGRIAVVVVNGVRDVMTVEVQPEPAYENSVSGILHYDDATVIIPNLDDLFKHIPHKASS